MFKTQRLAGGGVLLALALLPSCGEAPIPLDNQERASQPSANPHAVPPQSAPAQDVRFSGVVRLRGELAEKDAGFVLVSIKPKGIRMPCYSRKYELADAPLQGDERVLEFTLDQNDSLGGLQPGELVLEARYDPDGFVESREGVVTSTGTATVGGTTHEVVLDSSEG